MLDVMFCVLYFRGDRRERGTEEEEDTQGRKQRTGFSLPLFFFYLVAVLLHVPCTRPR